VCARGKQGFGVPIGHWLKNELHDWARERLLDNPPLEQWFRPAAIQGLLNAHNSGKANYGKKLWALLIFAMWLQTYSKTHIRSVR